MKNLKILIYIILLLSIAHTALNTKVNLPICNIETAKIAIAPRIFHQQTIDGPFQHPILTRFLHNKVGIYTSELDRCYFNVLDPVYIKSTIGLIGLVSIVLSIFSGKRPHSSYLLCLILLLPLVSVFNIKESEAYIRFFTITASYFGLYTLLFGSFPKLMLKN